MQRLNKRLGRFGVGMLAGGVVFVGVQHADGTTTIHNNGFTADNVAPPGHPNYGSNASTADANWSVSVGATGILGTPDIVLTWLAAAEPGSGGGTRWETQTSWDGRGPTMQLDGNTGALPNGPLSIQFAPAAGFAAKVNSFDLDEWSGGGNMVVDWTLTGTSSGTIANGQWTRSSGGRDTISPSAGTGQLGETVTLSFTQTGGGVSYLAMDNLVFDQVPEPASAALIAGGLGALAMRRPRRK